MKWLPNKKKSLLFENHVWKFKLIFKKSKRQTKNTKLLKTMSYPIIQRGRRHIPAEESSLATDQIVVGLVACAVSCPICILLCIILVAVDSSNMQEIITLVQVPPNSQVCQPQQHRKPMPQPKLVHEMYHLLFTSISTNTYTSLIFIQKCKHKHNYSENHGIWMLAVKAMSILS